MNCDVCKTESQWLEIVGSSFICHKCIKKNRIMGRILNLKQDTFKFIVRKLKVKDYEALLKVDRDAIDSVVNLREQGLNFPRPREE